MNTKTGQGILRRLCKGRRRGEAEPVPQQSDLKQELRDCIRALRHNEQVFQLQTDPALIEQCIYERIALQARYRYLLGRARAEHCRMILGTSAREAMDPCTP